jgi:hypothetical protein
MAKGNVCYFCGTALTAGKQGTKKVEHVPPKMLFKAFDCDSITVPSCPLHNTELSQQDQALIAAFMKALDAGIGRYTLTPDVHTAIAYEKERSTFDRTKHSARPTPFFRSPTGALNSLPNVTASPFETEDWIRQITAGLVFDATHQCDTTIDWQNAVVHAANWYVGNLQGFENADGLEHIVEKQERTKVWEEELQWQEGWSASPRAYPSDIYRFFVAFAKPIFFKHVFYNAFVWYVGFEASQSTRNAIESKL